METIHIRELTAKVKQTKILISEALDEISDILENNILIGDINRPAEKKVKAKRVYRKRKDPAPFPPKEELLPDLDKGNAFYSEKPKRERKAKKDEGTIQP